MKRFSLIYIFILATLSVQAQQVYNSTGRLGKANYKKNATTKGFDPNKLILGGGFGLGLGNDIFSFNISPLVGYKFTDRLSVGIGLSYQYANYKNYRMLQNYQTGEITYKSPRINVIAPNAWARFKVFNNFFISAIGEYDFTNSTDYAWAQNGGMNIEKVKLKYGMPCLLLGVGYAQPISGNASFVIMASYDVLQKQDGKIVSDSQGNHFQVFSPYYKNLDIRMGVNIGF